MKLLAAIVLLSAGVLCSWALHDIPNRYEFQVDLPFPNQAGASTYKFFYTYDSANGMLKMAVKVLSLGWVGFGFSRDSFMPASDVVIGWVDSNGQSYFQDRYASARQTPRVDKQQDWTLIDAAEEDGYTIIEMERPLDTCDTEEDITINVGDTIYLVYSYSPLDPTSEISIPQHSYRASMLINLFGRRTAPATPADVDTFDILSDNVAVPNADTTYWCTTHRLPDNIINTTRYITSFDAVLSPDSAVNVHHVLVYKCHDLQGSAAENTSVVCDDVRQEIRQCRGGTLLLAAWAVGGTKFVLPEDVSYPIGGSRGDRYLFMEIHYDNPTMESGIIDSSGLRFEYTSTPRANNAGVIGVGTRISSHMFVPPNVPDYKVLGYCHSKCTTQHIPEGGITVFANFLHTHTVGYSLVLHHVRNGIEISPLDQNLYYDFNYQQTNHITPRVVLPGDDLILECRYNSSGRSFTTFGGESTTEEMCFGFMYIYPEIPITFCQSFSLVYEYTEWAAKYAPGVDLTQLERFRPAADFLNSFNWTDESLRALEAVNEERMQYAICDPQDGQPGYTGGLVTPPTITVPYVPPPPSCLRGGDGGATQLLYSTVAFVACIGLAMFV